MVIWASLAPENHRRDWALPGLQHRHPLEAGIGQSRHAAVLLAQLFIEAEPAEGQEPWDFKMWGSGEPLARGSLESSWWEEQPGQLGKCSSQWQGLG